MTAHVWSEEAMRRAFRVAYPLYGSAAFEKAKPMIGAMLDAAFEVDSEAIMKEATYAERDRW